MKWEAELLSVNKDDKNSNVVASVRFTDVDTGKVVTQDIPANDLTPDSLAAFCQRWIEVREQQNASFAAFSAFQSGKITLPRDVK